MAARSGSIERRVLLLCIDEEEEQRESPFTRADERAARREPIGIEYNIAIFQNYLSPLLQNIRTRISRHQK